MYYWGGVRGREAGVCNEIPGSSTLPGEAAGSSLRPLTVAAAPRVKVAGPQKGSHSCLLCPQVSYAPRGLPSRQKG